MVNKKTKKNLYMHIPLHLPIGIQCMLVPYLAQKRSKNRKKRKFTLLIDKYSCVYVANKIVAVSLYGEKSGEEVVTHGKFSNTYKP